MGNVVRLSILSGWILKLLRVMNLGNQGNCSHATFLEMNVDVYVLVDELCRHNNQIRSPRTAESCP